MKILLVLLQAKGKKKVIYISSVVLSSLLLLMCITWSWIIVAPYWFQVGTW